MNNFLQGCKLAIPVILGYVPIAISFGVLAGHYDFTLLGATLMSATVFAGASQFLATEMSLTHGAIEIGLVVFLVNLRHVMMTYSLIPMTKNLPFVKRAAIFSGITDETYALMSLSNSDCLKSWSGMAGLVLSCYLSWVLSTIVGVLFASALSDTISKSMNVAIYSLFVGLLVHALLQKPKYLILVVVTIISNTVLTFFVTSMVSLFICISLIPVLYLYFMKEY